MSANPDDVVDLEQVTDVVPPDKVKPAPKKTVPAKRTAPRTGLAAVVEEASFDEEAERAKIRAELEAEYRERLASQQTLEADASTDGLEETNYLHITPGQGEIVIHMVDDGLTYGPKVYMRGEELAVNPDENPWVHYSRTKQVQLWGKALFAKGPWPYGGYDLTDPELTPADKKRLLQVTGTESFG